MTALSRHTAIGETHTATRVLYQTIARFLDTIYGAQSGQCCIGMIDGDPRFEKLREEWYAWPRERRTVVQRLAHGTQRGLNVYTARCLFTAQKRSYATAHVSRWLWIDDASRATDCTMLVQTSAQSYQVWLQLDRAVTADEASQLQRRWRHAVGADGCSADGVHMTRVPGGVNTKHHGCFPVTMAQCTDTTYRVADLPWPDVPTTSDTLPSINLAHVETQRADLRPLFNEQGIPRRFKPHMQSYKVLTGEIVVHNRAGAPDRSNSRYWLAKGLAYCRYTYEDAYTILLALTDSTWLIEKGFDWHHTDIMRCIAKSYHEVKRDLAQHGQDWQARPLTAREQAYGATPATPDALPYTTKRKRRGRPSRVTPADVLTYWHDQACGDRCIYTRKETANALHISIATLDRHIKKLENTGAIKKEIPVHRQFSVVILTDRVSAPSPSDPLSSSIKNTYTESAKAEKEVLSAHPCDVHSDAENTPTPMHGETHPPDSPHAPVSALTDAITEAFDAITTTRTKKRIRQYLALNYPTLSLNDVQLTRHMDYERKRRKLAMVRALKLNGLKAEIRLAEYKAQKARECGTNAWRWWEYYRDRVRAELARRPPQQRRPRTVCEALPDPRAAGHAYEQELLDLVEAARPTIPRPSVHRAVRIHTTPSATNAVSDPPSDRQCYRLLANLYQRNGDTTKAHYYQALYGKDML